jgi:hypothetical protein
MEKGLAEVRAKLSRADKDALPMQFAASIVQEILEGQVAHVS